MRDRQVVLELPELEQRLSNLQTQVERLWRKAEASVPPIEQRLAAMADQYAEYLKRWATTVERHTQAVAQLEAYASEWKDASSRVRQETADRLQDRRHPFSVVERVLARVEHPAAQQRLRKGARALERIAAGLCRRGRFGHRGQRRGAQVVRQDDDGRGRFVEGRLSALHGPSRNCRTTCTWSGWTIIGAWPTPANSCTCARGPRRAISAAVSRLSRSDSAPRRTSVGQRIWS